jgi:ATP-binding protein involved in chromosome partitioning
MPLPLEIVGIKRPEVEIVWEDDHRSVYRARDLRLACRCASCIEEMTGRALLDPGRVPDDVIADQIHLIGQYAIGIFFSDGHQTGIYNFNDLRDNCPCEECARKRAGDGAAKR